MCIASQGSKASFAVESGRVITGSAEGEIFMWRTEKRRSDGSLVILPSCLLTGGRGASRAPVVAVVAALRENAEEVSAAIKTCHRNFIFINARSHALLTSWTWLTCNKYDFVARVIQVVISVSVDGSISQWLVQNGRFVETCWISGLMTVYLDQRAMSLQFQMCIQMCPETSDCACRCVATRGRAIQQTFSLCGGQNWCVAGNINE